MIFLLIFLGYAVGWWMTARRVAGQLYMKREKERKQEYDRDVISYKYRYGGGVPWQTIEEWANSSYGREHRHFSRMQYVGAGMTTALVWPVVLLWDRGFTDWFILLPKAERQRIRIQSQDKYIKKLEKICEVNQTKES